MNFRNKELETMPRAEIEALQLKLLKAQARRLYDISPFYHAKMRDANVLPEDIRELKDVLKLPTMKKTDLRDNYPDKLFVEPQERIIRYHVSSGTTGKPTVVGYTRNDIDNWAESLARCMASVGLGEGDVVQVSNGYGLFSGGLGFHYGAERLGATALPASTGNTSRQLDLMLDLPVTAIACTPSYLLHIIEVAKQRGIDIRNDTKLKAGFLGAEPWSEGTRKFIEDETGIKAINCYGASELSGPLFTECAEEDGIHVWGDLALIEIIDPETGEHCADGEKGEMVVTMLQREALPIMRYRIGDISSMTWEKCACGRTHPRLARLSGRVDDMLIVRGINVFPSQVEHVLGGIPEVSQHYQIEVEMQGVFDRMIVQVELEQDAFTDDILKLREITRKVSEAMKGTLNIKVDVQLMEPGALPRYVEKAKRVIDRRNLT